MWRVSGPRSCPTFRLPSTVLIDGGPHQLQALTLRCTRTHQEGGIASSVGAMPPGPSTERQALLVSTECCSVAALSESRSREG
ncbi:unnamed protein product [Pylaiella littoralis]